MNIKIDNLNKEFKSDGQVKKVLEDINLDINDGEFICLLGHSGCGKSTLLNIVAGFDKPTSGKVLIDGNSDIKPSIDKVTIFQNYGLLPWKNVEENVALGLDSLRIKGEKRKEIVKKYIDLVGLSDYRKHFPRELSGGMQQRVAIARALAVEPKALFMDEPFSALDPITRKKLQEDVLDIWQEKKMTVIFVTHDIEEAILLGSKIVILAPNPGRVKAVINNTMKKPVDKSSMEFYNMKDKILGIFEQEQYDKIEYYI